MTFRGVVRYGVASVSKVETNNWCKVSCFPKSEILSEVDSSIAQNAMKGLEQYICQLEERSSDEAINDDNAFDLIKYAVKDVGNQMLVMGECDGTFPVGSNWLPVFLKAVYVRPDLVRRLLHETARRAIDTMRFMKDLGVEAISCGNDIAHKHGPFLSQKHFRKFVLLSLKAITDACHKKNVPSIKYTDGNINPIKEDLRQFRD